jgi:DNA primase
MSPWVDFRVLKQSLGIEQVLASYRVQLKRVGGQYLRGRCPLPMHGSQQSRESFGVDLRKNVWACHSASCCKARRGKIGGTILDLVACMEGCSLPDAALRLQARGGPPDRTNCLNQLVSKRESVDGGPPELPRLPFRLRLSGWHPYVDQRRIARETAARFGLGYYAGRGFLRGRVVFPIHNARGELVAYAGRSLDGSEPR